MGYKFFNDPCLRQLTIYDLQRSDKTISGIFYTSEENISGRIFSKGNAGTEGDYRLTDRSLICLVEMLCTVLTVFVLS